MTPARTAITGVTGPDRAYPTNFYCSATTITRPTAKGTPALPRKAHKAKLAGADELTVWGIRIPLREFPHVDDLADSVVRIAGEYSAVRHNNIGSGEDVSNRDLAELVFAVLGILREPRL